MTTLRLNAEENQHNVNITGVGTCASWVYKLSDGAFVSNKPLQKEVSVTFLIFGHGRLDMGFYETEEQKLKIVDYNKIQDIMTPCAQVKCEREEKRITFCLRNDFETTFGDKTKNVTCDPNKKVWLCFNIRYGNIQMKVLGYPITEFISPNYGKNVFLSESIRLKEENPHSLFALDRPMQTKEKIHFSFAPMVEENHVPKTYYLRLAASLSKKRKEMDWVQFDKEGTLTLEMTPDGVKYMYKPIECETKSSNIMNGKYVWFQLFRASLEIRETGNMSEDLSTTVTAPSTRVSEVESKSSSYCRVYGKQNSSDTSSTTYDRIEETSLKEYIAKLKSNIQMSKMDLEKMESCLKELEEILFQDCLQPRQNVQSLLKEIQTQERGLESISQERSLMIENIRKIFF